MPRGRRVAPGGLVYHVRNRGVARLALCEKDADYEAFARVLADAMRERPTRVLSYWLMSNHWHMVIWPRKDGELIDVPRWLTHTHVMRWHAHYGTSGTGHPYQGRFRACPMETGEHFYAVLRYVERNAQRANVVRQAEEWRWLSLWGRQFGNAESRKLLADWPLPRSGEWLSVLNRPQSDAEMTALRRSVQRGTPFGSSQWQVRTAKRLGLEWTIRPRVRPRKNCTGE